MGLDPLEPDDHRARDDTPHTSTPSPADPKGCSLKRTPADAFGTFVTRQTPSTEPSTRARSRTRPRKAAWPDTAMLLRKTFRTYPAAGRHTQPQSPAPGAKLQKCSRRAALPAARGKSHPPEVPRCRRQTPARLDLSRDSGFHIGRIPVGQSQGPRQRAGRKIDLRGASPVPLKGGRIGGRRGQRRPAGASRPPRPALLPRPPRNAKSGREPKLPPASFCGPLSVWSCSTGSAAAPRQSVPQLQPGAAAGVALQAGTVPDQGEVAALATGRPRSPASALSSGDRASSPPWSPSPRARRAGRDRARPPPPRRPAAPSAPAAAACAGSRWRRAA